MKYELKDLINDNVFIEKMNKAFADLRADYELELDMSFTQIEKLNKVHIDVNNHLSDLVTYSTTSSGKISGLRGTGKTHLLLMARNKLHENIFNDKTFVLYLNVKRLHLPTNLDQEIFNRVFSNFMYSELTKQLSLLLKIICGNSFKDKLLGFFNGDKLKLGLSLNTAIKKICFFIAITKCGSVSYENLDKGQMSTDDVYHEICNISTNLTSSIGLENLSFTSETLMSLVDEYTSSIKKDNIYQTYLNINDIRQQLIEIVKILKLNGISFYVDEWEKLYNINNAQKYLAFYIDKINDTPFYFWLSVVPHRGGIYCLDTGADLQHLIDLDESLIYEKSKSDKERCMNYFRQFIDKRLDFFLPEYNISYQTLFNDEHKLEQLVLASMGNSRDFGTMLLFSWSCYQRYRGGELAQGRPYKYISYDMIKDSIKNDGTKKLSNITDNSSVMKLWTELNHFCVSKRSSHFAILETTQNMQLLNNKYFSELIYHRLLHYRIGHIASKDLTVTDKLSIYALSYSTTYDSHSIEKKFSFIISPNDIHDKVRRYIFNPDQIINTIQIEEGDVILCKSCKHTMNIRDNKACFEKNFCPRCGNTLY